MNKVIRQGETLKINGENIYPGADTVVYWNSVSQNNLAKIVVPPSDSSVSVLVPEGLLDTNKIVICNSVGCYTGTQQYDYVGFPQVDSFSHISRNWGSEILLRGNHLKGVTGVRLDQYDGETYYTSFDLPSKNKLTFYMPNDFAYGNVNLLSKVGSFSSTQFITGIAPPIEGKFIDDGKMYFGDTITVQGRSLHKVNRLKMEGLNQDIYVNSGQITKMGSTGLHFQLPQGIKEVGSLYLQNQSGQFSNNTNSSTVYEEFGVYPLNVYSPSINSVNKSYAKYNEEILVSGINLNKSKILFLDYNDKYTQGSLVNSGEYYQTVRTPKNTQSNRILASGSQSPYSGLAFSTTVLNTLPTIESTSGDWSVGSVVKINAINAFNTFEAVGITGSNLVKSGLNEIAYVANAEGKSNANYHFGVMSYDNSSMIPDASLGQTVISAVVNSDFIGEGHPFLIDKKQIGNENSIQELNSNLSLYNIKSFIPSVTGAKITISGKKPNVTKLSVYKTSSSGTLGISGNYFLGATGVQIFGGGQTSTLSHDHFIGHSTPNTRGIGIFRNQVGVLSDYDQTHFVNLNLNDFTFTNKYGELKILTPYHE